MTVGHVYNHFILHTQQIFTLSLMVALTVVFGNFATVKTATIPTTYREEILGISVTGMIILLISVIYDLFSDVKSKFTIEEVFKDLKFWHHIISFIFVTAVVGISAVYLNQGNIPQEISIAITVTGALISVFTFGVIIYCFNKTISSRRDVYQQAIRKVDTRRQNSLIG
tara:strand:+ start:537 stop:1043 length:507 start_codon:yes stop_codon:yes gene_type:complete